MSSQLTDKIAQIIEPVVEDLGYELVRVMMMANPRGEGAPTLQIMAEKPDGTMTVDGCEKISREISVLLDVEDPISGEYSLEVSSPGLDRPLTRKKDFVNYAGYEAKAELSVAVDGRKRYRGILLGMDENDVLIKVDGEEVRLNFEDIAKSKLVMTDELMKQATKKQ